MRKHVLTRILPLSVLAFALVFGSFSFNTHPTEASNTYSIDLESGSSNYLSSTDNANLSITGNLTIEAWVKLESQPATDSMMAIVSKWDGAGGGGFGDGNKSYMLWYNDVSGTKKFTFLASSNGSSGTSVAVSHTLTTGTWTHVAVVYTAASGQAQFFVNGASIGSASGLATSLHDNASGFGIGARDFPYSTATEFFDGKLDDVRLWNVARTSTEIADDRNRELNGNESGLKGYWKLNNDLTDTSGNNNTLSHNNGSDFSPDPAFSDTTPALKVRKPSDESRINTTTLENDDHLVLTLAANTTYIIDGVLLASAANATPDITIAFYAPTGATTTIVYTNDVNEAILTSGATSTRINLQDGTPMSIHLKGTIKTSATGGTVQLKWAQTSSSGSATKILEGSYLRAESI